MSIELKNVTMQFRNGVTALEDASLVIPGGLYGLLGENGAGKTTLMRILATILRPIKGKVSLNGTEYSEANAENIQQKIGYLPQELSLYPNLTVRECLEYLGELANLSKQKCSQRIDFYLEKTGLTEHQKKKNRQLSGGMKRRVGLVQALLHEPEFLIVDEPTTGLDPEERVHIRNLLTEFSKNRTVLFSTHVVEDLAATSNQLAIMKKGRFVYSGSTAHLLKEAKGHIWTCGTADDELVKSIEKSFPLTSKQYTETGLKLKVIAEQQPDENFTQPEITLEDAYRYMMSRS